MGWLADRVKRVPIVGWASLAFGVLRVPLRARGRTRSCSFWTRFATGIAKANSIPVHQSLIADNYPIGIRARMSAVMNMGAHGIGLVSPVLCAAIATWAGGVEGWRWAWYLLGIPVVVRRGPRLLHEGAAPRAVREAGRARRGDRGRAAGADLDGGRVRPHQADPHDPHRAGRRSARSGSACSASPSSSRSTSTTTCTCTSVLERGVILSLSGIVALPLLPFVGRYFDRKYREDPARALALVGTARSCRRRCSPRCSSPCTAPPGSGS